MIGLCGYHMPTKQTRSSKPKEEYTLLSLRVERYEVELGASVNPYAYHPQYAWDLDESDLVYKFSTQLAIMATSIRPEKRAGDTYELTLHSDNAPPRWLTRTLQDLQLRDKHGSLQYRQYRGKQVPVYRSPKGLGTLDKIRGEPRWTAWLFVPNQFTSDILTLLGHQKTLFIALHERKEARDRWVHSMSLQTVDPTEEE